MPQTGETPVLLLKQKSVPATGLTGTLFCLNPQTKDLQRIFEKSLRFFATLREILFPVRLRAPASRSRVPENLIFYWKIRAHGSIVARSISFNYAIRS